MLALLGSVALGAFAGGILRSLLADWCNLDTFAIPIGTLLANVLGSFALGLVLGFMSTGTMPQTIHTMIVTGFCGGLTTFSTFTGEVCSMFEKHTYSRGLLYWIGSVLLTIALVALGFALGRLW